MTNVNMYLGPLQVVVSKGTPTYPWSTHTPGFQFSPPNDSGIPNHKLLVGGLGYVPGVCSRGMLFFFLDGGGGNELKKQREEMEILTLRSLDGWELDGWM